MNSAQSKRPLGILMFAAGILLGTFLITALTWASFEAAFYEFQFQPGDHFDGLVCPALMTPHETAIIQIQISNPANKAIEPIIRVDVSTRGIPDTKEVQLQIQPGETRQLEQSINAENIDLGFFIFAKAYRYPSYPLPDAYATCGVLIIDVPFLSGRQIFYIWLAFSLILIPLGLWIWSSSLSSESADRMINAAKVLSVFVLGGLLFSIKGIWVLGLLFLVLILLMFIAMLRFLTTK